MSKPQISEEDKRELRNSAKEELERLEAIYSNVEVNQLLNEFKGKYNICESVYKVILAEHQRVKGNRGIGYPKVSMTQVPYAWSFAGYGFDKGLLTEIFGSHSPNGQTVKKLRDAVTHGIDNKAVQEISARREELFGYMDTFLSGIRDFDTAA